MSGRLEIAILLLWLIEAGAFQMPQLHKHFNGGRHFKMTRQLFISTVFVTLTALTGWGQTTPTKPEIIEKIEMKLSAFGVEADDFPSIDAVLNFSKDTNLCIKSYYNPAYNGSTYRLSRSEMTEIISLLKISDVKKLKPEYQVSKTDQLSSETIIYTNKAKYLTSDYGLVGDFPLKELYKIVYKL